MRSFAVKPKGASFELVDSKEFLWHILATDVDWSPEGALCVTDWVDGWDGCGKGRIYKVFDPATQKDPVVLEVKQMIAEGMTARPVAELVNLLSHADMRIRQEAQFELAARALAGKGDEIVPKLIARAVDARDDASKLRKLARIHAIWALGQIGRKNPKEALQPLVALAADADPEIRASRQSVGRRPLCRFVRQVAAAAQG